MFADYFTREVLAVGHHLDLLLDIDSTSKKYLDKDIDEVLAIMKTDYELKGYIKRISNRVAGDTSKTDFLKYEKILWQSLGLMDKKYWTGMDLHKRAKCGIICISEIEKGYHNGEGQVQRRNEVANRQVRA